MRERTVLGRIGPLLSSRRSGRAIGARQMSDARLGGDSPAMLVDGDQNFRHAFISVASQYGAIIGAESGADALARFRRTPVGMVFIGDGLGIMGAEALVRKIREVETAHTRVIGVGVPPDAAGPGKICDAVIARAFIPDTLARELRPCVRIPGPLARRLRNVPATMLATSPMASGTSPLTSAAGMPSMLPVMVLAATIEL